MKEKVSEKKKMKKKNSFLWLFEPFEDDPRFIQKKLFSFDAAYLDGRLYVAVSDGKEPWSGLLVCTSRQHHASLLSEFPTLEPHSVLGKWLHISPSHPEFESTATTMISVALRRDARLGVDSSAFRSRRPR
jgi:hypothetical protein